eukprot:6075090-Ditylum_brightwellii.AAC.1
MEHHKDPVTGELDYFHPLAFAAKLNDVDNPNWFQATRGSNSNGFWEAIWVEIITITKIKAFEIVPRT